jgi:site-specific DNA-cytosine methylase
MRRRCFQQARKPERAVQRAPFGHGPPQAKKRNREDKAGEAQQLASKVPRGPTVQSTTLSIGTVCSGMGAAHRAVQMLQASCPAIGWVHLFACENKKAARRVLRADFPGLHVYGDLVSDPPREYVDFLVGGFPCQPFSAANRNRRGSDDPRCQVVDHLLLYVEKHRPKAVLLENVPGMLSWGMGTLEIIVTRLQSAGHRSERDLGTMPQLQWKR